MARFIVQQRHMARMSELMAQRRRLEALERELRARASACGLSLLVAGAEPPTGAPVWSDPRRAWAAVSPLGGWLFRLVGGALERGWPRPSPACEAITGAMQGLWVWGRVAFGLAEGPLPGPALEAELSAKALRVQRLGQDERFGEAMGHFWRAARAFERCWPRVRVELNGEIQLLALQQPAAAATLS